MTNHTSAESATTTPTTADADEAKREERNRKQRERRAAKKDAAKATTAKPKATATERLAETPADPWKGNTPREVLLAYLKGSATADTDAPNRLMPFIDGKDTLRMHSSHWRDWLAANAYAVTKREAGAVLKDAGLVQKVYSIPGEDRSAGFHTGPAPRGTAELPRRVVERAQRTPRPVGKLSAEQNQVLWMCLTAYEFGDDEAERATTRDQLLELLPE
jgi:hypothetical protein